LHSGQETPANTPNYTTTSSEVPLSTKLELKPLSPTSTISAHRKPTNNMSHSRENVNITAENLINVAINLAEYSSQLQRNIESLNTFVAKKPTPQIFFYSGTVACHSTRFWIAFNSAAAKEAESKEDIPEKVTGSSHKITLVKVNGRLSISPRKPIANTAQPEEHASRKDDRSLTRKSPTITIYSENGQLSLTPKKTTNATQPEEHATSKDNGSPTRKRPTIKIYSDNGRLSLSPKKSTNTTLTGKDILNKVIGSHKVTKWISARQKKSTSKVASKQRKTITLTPKGSPRVISWKVSPALLQKYDIPRKSIEESDERWFPRQRASPKKTQRQKDILNRTTQAAKVAKEAALPRNATLRKKQNTPGPILAEQIQLFNIQMAAREADYQPVKTPAQIRKEEKERVKAEKERVKNRPSFTHHRTRYGKTAKA
jgi:hypothetical protein